MTEDNTQESLVKEYVAGTVIAYKEKILMYVGALLKTQTHVKEYPPETQLYIFKELMPAGFRPHIEPQEGYEKMKREASVLGF